MRVVLRSHSTMAQTATPRPMVSIESSFTAFVHGRYILEIESRARKLRMRIRNLSLDCYDPLRDSEHYLNAMDDLRESYTKHLEKIFQLVPKSDTMEDRETGKRIEGIFDECRTELMQLNNEKAMAKREQIAVKYRSVPSFDGDVKDWVKFRSEFQSQVMQNSSKDDEKRQVFQLKVSSELVDKLPSGKSIETLWRELCAKFDQPASNFHVNELFGQHKLSKSMTREDISDFVESSEKHVRALQELGYEMNPLSEIMLGCLLTKKTPRSFQEYLQTVSRSITWTSVRSVLLDSAPSKTFPYSSNVSCFYCLKGHIMRRCDKFLKLPFEKRLEVVVKGKKLCHICLGPLRHHSVDLCCTMCTCNICHGKHNTVLHPANDDEKRKLALLNSLVK